MIIKNQSLVVSGFQAVIEAALSSGCRSYFAAPSPFHASLLSEGLKRFQEFHGSCIQAESPAAAVAMAQGAAATGSVPLVSGTETDFLQMQESLHYCIMQERPMVIVLLLQGAAVQNYQQLRFFLDPVFLSGFSLITLLPSHLQGVYDLTRQAFQWAVQYHLPTLLILDAGLFHNLNQIQEQAPIRLNYSPLFKGMPPHTEMAQVHTLSQKNQAMQDKKHQILTPYLPPAPRCLIMGMGSTGGWLSQGAKSDWGILLAESLWPFPVNEILQIKDPWPHLPLYFLEYEAPFLTGRLNQLYPQLAFEPLLVQPPQFTPGEIIQEIALKLGA